MSSFSLAIIFIASCCTAFATPSTSIFPDGRIVGGEDVKIEDTPWQALLQFYGFAYCGASIISSEWVITAGHCVGFPVESITVKVGSAMKDEGGSTHQAKTVIRHENYGMNNYGVPMNDVAVIRVETAFQLDATRRPIVLFNYQEEAPDGILSIISGWGAVREGGSTSAKLQMAKVPIVSKQVCNDAYESYGGLPNGQICAAHPKGGKDSCQGDSGGPLTIGGRLAGIVSWGNGCARPGYPGVYTEVATYRNWIADKVGV